MNSVIMDNCHRVELTQGNRDLFAHFLSRPGAFRRSEFRSCRFRFLSDAIYGRKHIFVLVLRGSIMGVMTDFVESSDLRRHE